MPGICCKAFYIDHDSPPWGFMTISNKETVLKRLRKYNLPFRIVGKTKYWWVFGCNKLNANGRCDIYYDRPQLCKKYRAGTGKLCCESKKFHPINLEKINVAK